MWPFNKKSRISDKDRIAALKPGESWEYTAGIGGCVTYRGALCGICGKEFQFVDSFPPRMTKALGPYEYASFGKYKPSRVWYCRSHSNAEIEAKILELDF